MLPGRILSEIIAAEEMPPELQPALLEQKVIMVTVTVVGLVCQPQREYCFLLGRLDCYPLMWCKLRTDVK
eukprot:14713286-Ditylum_brightwellii.AAC.1